MTDDNSKIPAQDMTGTDPDNTDTETQDNSPRVFDITSDLNIAPVKDDVVENTQNPIDVDRINVGQKSSETVQTNQMDMNQPEKTLDITTDQIVIEPESTSSITNKPPVTNLEKFPVSQFGPANPPAKTVGMNQNTLKDNLPQQNKIVTEQKNLQDAIASIKTTNPTLSTPITNVPERPWEAKPDSKIKPLRTYEIDFAEAMAKKRISSASIAIAENKKRDAEIIQQPKNIVVPQKYPEIPKEDFKKDETNIIKEKVNNVQKPNQEIFVKNDILKNAEPPKDKIIPKESHATRNWLLAIFSLILICGGGYSAFYLYQKSPLATSSVKTENSQSLQTERIKSIVSPDSKTILDVTNKNQNSIISAIKTEISKPQPEKTLKEIILTKTTENTISKVKASEVLQTMGISTPDILSRSIGDEWMLGVYSGIGEQKSVFIITTNNFFQNTFAGLIQWEKTMPQDLKEYLYSGSDIEDFTIRGQYKDKIIKNKDVREYVADNGHISFLYSFISNDKLVITNSENALEEIIARLEKDAFIR